MINYNKVYKAKNQEKYILDVLNSGKLSGDHIYTKNCNKMFNGILGINNSLFTTSCSSALDMSMLLLDLKEGDEVIMPSFNFVSSANAVVLRGAKPVFADIDEATMNVSFLDVSNKITSRTKAIIPVHYAGVSCDMDKYIELSKAQNILIVEDAAQGINAFYKNKPLGTIGDIGVYSFHETKNYSCGEGGAITIRNHKLYEKAEIIREKGTDRSKFLRGQVDKYTWQMAGSSYLPSDLLMALLLSQLEELEHILTLRKNIYEAYYNALSTIKEIQLPTIPDYAQSNYHIFHFFTQNSKERDELIKYLYEHDIQGTSHYVPLHLSPMGKNYMDKTLVLPKTEDFANRLIRLPIYPDLKENELDEIIETIYQFYKKK